MEQEVIITGAKFSKGDIDGRPYDSTKLYIQVPMDMSRGEQVGFATVEYNWGLSDNFYKLRDLSFPLKATITRQEVTSGRSTKVIITDVKPHPQTQTKQ